MPTLLAVDDEPSVLYSYQRIFGDNGVRVVTAETVAEGLRQFHTCEPDVALLDLKLPDGSGMEIFEEIRATAQQTMAAQLCGVNVRHVYALTFAVSAAFAGAAAASTSVANQSNWVVTVRAHRDFLP